MHASVMLGLIVRKQDYMKRNIVIIFSLLLAVCATVVIYFSVGEPNISILQIGTFIVLTLTLIVLIFYAFDTNALARISQKRWEKESILFASYSMEGIGDKGKKGRILFRISNPSTLMLRAKVWCNFQVYGNPVDYSDDFNGKNIWYIFPGQTSQGWYEIETLLTKKGKTVDQMMNEYTDENRTHQLTLDLKIEFRDEMDNKRELPTRRHYFAFNDWFWIPELTVKEDW